MLDEATVRLPPLGSKWVAVFTAAEPGKQTWRSTGLTDRDAALAKALRWEQDAKRQRAALGLTPRKPNIRVQRRLADPSGKVAPGVEPMSQREIAMILKISERAVRVIEQRALEKLRRHPMLRELWAEYDTGERLDEPDLEEQQETELTPGEIAALFGLVRTDEEQQALAKLLTWIGSREP